MNIPNNPNVVECTLERSTVGVLRRRIHLPLDVQAVTHEERFIVASILDFQKSYNYQTGWSVVFLDARFAVIQADRKEVILRRHRLGNFILFRVWKG